MSKKRAVGARSRGVKDGLVARGPLTVRQGGTFHHGTERPVHVHAVGLYRELVFGEWLQSTNEDVFSRAAKARNAFSALRRTSLLGRPVQIRSPSPRPYPGWGTYSLAPPRGPAERSGCTLLPG